MKERNLCGKCAALLREAFKITEFGRRERLLCENCGNRRYGCKCRIEQKEKAEMTRAEYENEHSMDSFLDAASAEPLGKCDHCGDDALPEESGYVCKHFDIKQGREISAYVHKECFLEWLSNHFEPEELAALIGWDEWRI